MKLKIQIVTAILFFFIMISFTPESRDCEQFGSSLNKRDKNIMGGMSQVDWLNGLENHFNDTPKSIAFYEVTNEHRDKEPIILEGDSLFLTKKMFYLPDGRIYRREIDENLFTQYYYDTKGRLIVKEKHQKFDEGYSKDLVHRWIYNDSNEIKQRYSYELKAGKKLISEFGSTYKYKKFAGSRIEIQEREMLDDSFSETAYKIYDNTVLYNGMGSIIFFRNHDIEESDDYYDRVSHYEFDKENRLVVEEKYRPGLRYRIVYTYNGKGLIKKSRINGKRRHWLSLTFYTTKGAYQLHNNFLVPNESRYESMSEIQIPENYRNERIEKKYNSNNDLIEERKIYKSGIVVDFYKYKYDSHGNWVKKTRQIQKFDKNNVPITMKKRSSVRYRKIEYFTANEIFCLPDIPVETAEAKERRLVFMSKLNKEGE